MTDKIPPMNYRYLKNRLLELSEAQLDMPVMISVVDEPVIFIEHLEVLAEDLINPSGEGCEPVSLYCLTCDHEQDDCVHGEPIVFKKGTVFLEACL